MEIITIVTLIILAITISNLQHELSIKQQRLRQVETEFRAFRQNICPIICHKRNMTCANCSPKIYAKTSEQQEIADLLKNSLITIEEVAKRLDMQIK